MMNKERITNWLRRDSVFKSLRLVTGGEKHMIFIAEYHNARPHKITVTKDSNGTLQAYIVPTRLETS